MKRYALLTGMWLTLVSAGFGSPQCLTYQGSVLDAGGNPVADGPYDMRFTIYDAATGGTGQWSETDTAVQVTGGLFSTTLGDGTSFSLSLFSSGLELWLEVAIDINGNQTFEAPAEVYSPRQRLLAAAWAMEADRLEGHPASDFAAANHWHPGGGSYWSLGGNGGTTSGTHFVGTLDAVPLDLRTSSVRALRLEPNSVSPNVIGGYGGNAVTPGVVGAVIGGGGRSGRPNLVTADLATVGGGQSNTASHWGATVGGGNVNTASGDTATVAGGQGNTASDFQATVGGGYGNTASQAYATVGGGYGNTASGECSTVGGGEDNASTASHATVGGGYGNTASGESSMIGGGRDNASTASCATVAGGRENTVSDRYATVGGGYSNTARNDYATVPGGTHNEAGGSYSLAAGQRAKARHPGAFVWADSRDFDFPSATADQFCVRATGGVLIVSAVDGTGTPTAGVELLPGANSWSPIPPPSDRDRKANFSDVNARAVLERLQAIPIETWNYDFQDTSIRHMGPMAQDFYAAFGVGRDNRHIETVDADGVAFAAIQGLCQIVQEKDARIASQEQRIEQLETRLAAQQQKHADLEARMATLEAALNPPGP